jgi:hypothetical protein
VKKKISRRALSVFLAAVGGLTCRDASAEDAAAEPKATGGETWTSKPTRSFQSLVGVRVSGFSAGSDAPSTLGVGASFQSSGYENYGPLSLRSTGFGSIGKSAHGLEGIHTGDIAIGGILRLGRGHGPLFRVGARGYMMGNERVWLSSFEIPSGHVGYQYAEGPWLFEIAGRTGMIVTGRHTLYGMLDGFEVLQRRALGHPSLEVGGHAAFGYGRVRAELEYMHVAVADRIGTPLDVWTASACYRPSTFGACVDYRSWKADVYRIDGRTEPLAVGYGGVSIGIWSP